MVDTEHSESTARQGWSYQSLPAMDDDQFRQWQTLLESRTGMTLPPERRSFLEANLGIRMRELGCNSYQAYYDRIMSGPGAIVEWATLVDRLTVQETRFFRDPDAFRLIQDYLGSRFADNSIERPLEAWSVGCSTGEEAYSLAIVLNECFADRGDKSYFGVTGTDISQPALNKAKEATYSGRKLVTTHPHWQEKYFIRQDDNRFQVSPAIRDRVCFSRLNVLDLQQAPMHGMAIIYCQNLLIYFRRWRRRDIVNRLVERLAPGGLLILGQGELTDWHHPEMERLSGTGALAWKRRRTV